MRGNVAPYFVRLLWPLAAAGPASSVMCLDDPCSARAPAPARKQ